MFFTKFSILLISVLLYSCDTHQKSNDLDKLAFANIEFGTHRKEYEAKMDSLLLDIDKQNGYYRAGDFLFNNIAPSFHNDKLVKISLSGYKYSSFALLHQAVNEIKETLTKKYGNTTSTIDLLDERYFNHTNLINGHRWSNKYKSIELKYLKHSFDYELIMEIEDIIGIIDRNHERSIKNSKEKNKLQDII